MALNINKNLKAYYSIREVAQMIGVSEPTLRYWETEFPFLKPRTTANKVRQYQDKDIENIRLIYGLVKVRGMKIAAARKAINANRAGVEHQTKILERLIDVKSQLMELKGAMEKIVWKDPPKSSLKGRTFELTKRLELLNSWTSAKRDLNIWTFKPNNNNNV